MRRFVVLAGVTAVLLAVVFLHPIKDLLRQHYQQHPHQDR